MENKNQYKIKDLPLQERPQERLLESGPDNLKSSELLALIMRTGYKNERVL